MKEHPIFLLTLAVCMLATGLKTKSQELERLSYNNPGLTVDLAVGLRGWPSPNFADFNGNGKLDIICGEFRDGFTFFKNVGTREVPLYEPGRPLTYNDKRLVMDLCMVIPVAYDFTGNGYIDLIVGDEAGRVALMEHTGKVVEGMPKYLPPRFFQQEADKLNFGALSTPAGFDWTGNGLTDLIMLDH